MSEVNKAADSQTKLVQTLTNLLMIQQLYFSTYDFNQNMWTLVIAFTECRMTYVIIDVLK